MRLYYYFCLTVMDTGNYIKELLILHDCVIIPGLGGFVANYRSAEVNYMHQTISPPSKSILFNRNLHYNDGLLIGHISKRAGIGYKDAEAITAKYAENINKSTRSGSKFTIDELGFFYQDKQKNIQFQAELSSNFLLESYGLSDVYFREMYKAVEQAAKPSRYISAEMSVSNRKKRIRRLVYTGIAASLLAAMVLIPIKTGYLDYTGLRLFKETTEITDKPAIEADVNIQQIVTDEIPKPGTIEIVSSEYHIITGSFRKFGNARELMKKLNDQGYTARILSGEGAYFRVSAMSFDDMPEAVETLSGLKKLPGMGSAWILKY